jgi:hypothetical protein
MNSARLNAACLIGAILVKLLLLNFTSSFGGQAVLILALLYMFFVRDFGAIVQMLSMLFGQISTERVRQIQDRRKQVATDSQTREAWKNDLSLLCLLIFGFTGMLFVVDYFGRGVALNPAQLVSNLSIAALYTCSYNLVILSIVAIIEKFLDRKLSI